ncbi:DUF1028 domain-containing protein [Reyranella sp.]|uniref:DUF1028 domain-containing protein n=1 Tax=Reyranella sp. TaxID=1929291 RepID=UPI003BAA82C3
MTFSIIARCPQTGRLGLGVTTFSIAAGGRCEGIRFGAGVSKTQAYVKRDNDLIALELLEQGRAPAGVMAALKACDPDHDWRQIGIIDREGTTCAHTGPGCRPWAGHHEGAGFVAFGNVLAGPEVIDGIVAGYLREPGAGLEFRLLAALEGGRDAGGQVGAEGHLTERSAAIFVSSEPDHFDIDVRVDLHDDAVTELRRVLEEFKIYEKFYRDRGFRPDLAMSQAEFVASLPKKAVA